MERRRRQAKAAGASYRGTQDPGVWTNVERIVAIGDIHGDYDQLAAVLKSAGLIDDQGSWTGGKTHLVQVGDVLDRGPDSRKAMDLLMRIEKEAPEAGGYVHALIGNHEAMNVYGDLRYTSMGEYAAFQDENSELRDEELKKSTPPTRPSGWRSIRLDISSIGDKWAPADTMASGSPAMTR